MIVNRPMMFLCALVIAALACNLQPTPTPGSGVAVTVTTATNCRMGPGTEYEIVLTVNPGMSFEVVGANRSLNYWIIRNPAGGTCWLWGQYAIVTGDTSTLPEYPPPPTR